LLLDKHYTALVMHFPPKKKKKKEETEKPLNAHCRYSQM